MRACVVGSGGWASTTIPIPSRSGKLHRTLGEVSGTRETDGPGQGDGCRRCRVGVVDERSGPVGVLDRV